LKKLFVGLFILFAGISICFAAPGLNMQEGLWEITVKNQMPGMDMPPMTQTQCLSKEDFIPKGSVYQGEKCTIEDIKITGNTVTWSHECEAGGEKIKGTGKMTYSGDRFEGTMMMSLPQINLYITTEMNGRRIGDCN
jgi:hypothetical protein